jgi:hypothetical protein
MNTTSSKSDVIKAGEEALACVYEGLPLEGLNILCWRKFTAKVITGNTSDHVKSLPPTSDSAKFHSLRVYYQCQKWISVTVDIDPMKFFAISFEYNVYLYTCTYSSVKSHSAIVEELEQFNPSD